MSCQATDRFSFGLQSANVIRRGAPHGFIGRVERLEEDLRRLLKMLDMPVFPLMHSNASGAKTVTARARPGGACYDAATWRLVARLYARYLELLGYRFEDGDAAGIRRSPASLPGEASGERKGDRFIFQDNGVRPGMTGKNKSVPDLSPRISQKK